MSKQWVPAHTRYSVCLVGGTFADSHGGECDYYNGVSYTRKKLAQIECDARNRRGRKDGGRFEVRNHSIEAGWVYSLSIEVASSGH